VERTAYLYRKAQHRGLVKYQEKSNIHNEPNY
jgi:hypothetical protein